MLYSGIFEFAAPTLEGVDAITAPCLLFYEGKHASMNGNASTFSAAKISAIAAATNKWLETRRIKIYVSASDHDISQASAIGYLSGGVTVEALNSTNAPNLDPELYGKLGIFGIAVIAGEDNVAQYRDGRLKELSVGLSAKNEIVEVSAVAIPSLAGAQLFALDLGEAIAETEDSKRFDKVQGVLWTLFRTLRDIGEATSESLAGANPSELKDKAISDFCAFVKASLSPPPFPSFPPPPPILLMNTMSVDPAIEKMAAQITQLEAAHAAAERKIQLFSRYSAAAQEFADLQKRAIALRDAGKLSGASYTAKFGVTTIPIFGEDLEAAESVIADFETFCEAISAILKECDQFGVAVKFGMLPAAPVDSEADAAKAEVDSVFSNYVIHRTY